MPPSWDTIMEHHGTQHATIMGHHHGTSWDTTCHHHGTPSWDTTCHHHGTQHATIMGHHHGTSWDTTCHHHGTQHATIMGHHHGTITECHYGIPHNHLSTMIYDLAVTTMREVNMFLPYPSLYSNHLHKHTMNTFYLSALECTREVTLPLHNFEHNLWVQEHNAAKKLSTKCTYAEEIKWAVSSHVCYPLIS